MITGCYNTSSGALKLVDAGTKCAKGEKPISWNQAGVPGTDGDDGTDGADGVSGIQAVFENFDQNVPFVRAHSFTVDCPDGKAAISGGGIASVLIDGSGAGLADLRSSGPVNVINGVPHSWGISLGYNDAEFFPETARIQGNISVVCATVP